jgi:ribosomal protein S18 acetylase RimI-like enzyme
MIAVTKYRTMSIDDYDEIYALWANTPGMGLNSLDDSRGGIEKYLERNPRTCFVAETDGRITGTILSGHDGRRGFIYHTAVAIGERKKGLGRALVKKAMEALREEGINKVALVVIKENDLGNEFWERAGFSKRADLVYRNMVISEKRMETIEISAPKE